MEVLIQLACYLLFGFVGFKAAENLNEKHGLTFEPRIWAAIGFLFGIFGIAGLGCYAFFKINCEKKGDE
jgi:uncharacterized membrane protein YfcA